MNRQARIYLLSVDAAERRILMQLPDSALDAVEKIKKVFGKDSRLVAHRPATSEPTGTKNAQTKLV